MTQSISENRPGAKVEHLFGQAVCEPQEVAPSSAPRNEAVSPLAHPSDRLLIQLNHDWRVTEGGLQYILQRRRGHSRSKATGWIGCAFCRTRAALLRNVRELCGEIDENALSQLQALPEWHPDGPVQAASTPKTNRPGGSRRSVNFIPCGSNRRTPLLIPRGSPASTIKPHDQRSGLVRTCPTSRSTRR